jgi:hypothetical protein
MFDSDREQRLKLPISVRFSVRLSLKYVIISNQLICKNDNV